MKFGDEELCRYRVFALVFFCVSTFYHLRSHDGLAVRILKQLGRKGKEIGIQNHSSSVQDWMWFVVVELWP